MKRSAMVGLAVLLAVATACTSAPRGQSGERARDLGPPRPAATVDFAYAGALRSFDACDDLLGYFIDHALELVGPYGLGDAPIDYFAQGEAAAAEPMDDAGGERASADPAPVAGEDFSGTNVQEAGVDEPDIVKTDGRRIVTMARERLRIVDVTGDEPRQVAAIEVPGGWGQELLMDGDRVLVLATADRSFHPMPAEADARIGIAPGPIHTATSVLTLVDIADPSAPRIEATLTLDGGYVSARMVDGVARVVLRSQPTGLAFVYPEGGGLRAEQEAIERNREIIRSSTVDNWIPYYVLEERRDGRAATSDGRLLDCERVHHQEEFAGLGLVSVLSIDVAGPLSPAGGAAVVGQGETVYASTESLYVALTEWDWEAARLSGSSETSTKIHKFDISDPRAAEYRASGELPGHLLSQWSMSEHNGALRVATTEGDAWGWGGEESESAVTVFEERDDRLRAVGRVEGLGKGERIYAVRMMGDVGYVVTFRETDPLYTLDLADPAQPRAVGELKILGYSAYLHPVGDGLLLGVGQDATEEGRRLGTQVSLFDVSDPSTPTRVTQLSLAEGSDYSHSEVEYDHRAFLHWPQTGLVMLPYARYSWDDETGKDDSFIGAVGLSVRGADSIERLGEITHGRDGRDMWAAQIRRSVVIGDQLFTLSEHGLAAHDLATLADEAWVGW